MEWGLTTERFASPLNFNLAFKSYFSMYSEDQLLEQIMMHSHKQQGAFQANPKYEAVAMEKALWWALFSTQSDNEPVLTTFVLPW